MVISKNLTIIYISICMFFACASSVFASVFTTTQPQNPKPGDTVTVTVGSYLMNMQTAIIRWSRDGDVLLEGIGRNRFVISNIIEQDEIQVEVVNGQTNERFTQVVRINPSNIDLLWESTGVYVPPFYKGKALVNIEGGVRFTAIPNTPNRNSVFFNWTKDTANVVNVSGIGKDTFSFGISTLDDANVVGVSAFDSAQDYSAQSAKNISFEQPRVLFYEQHPTLGTLFNRAIPREWFVSRSTEYRITAIPYFFGASSLEDSDVLITWRAGNQTVPVSGQQNSVRIQTPNVGGTVNLIADFKHTTKRYQDGAVGINLRF